MAQIRNKLDIQDSILDDILINTKKLPNFFNVEDDINISVGIGISIAIHAVIIVLMLILSALGIVFPLFNPPELPKQDIEFKLVQNESKPPINKNTKVRSDRDSQAGGKHDPKRAVSEPSPKGQSAKSVQQSQKQTEPKTEPKKSEVKNEPKKQVQKQLQPKVQPQKVQPQQKQAPQVKQQVQQTVQKPTQVKAPQAVKPNVKPTVSRHRKTLCTKNIYSSKKPF